MLTLHLTTEQQWADALVAGVYTGSTRGADLADEGFVHTSTEEQLPGVLRRFYSDVDLSGYRVLVIDTDACEQAGSRAVWDPVPDSDEQFLHIYGPVPVEAVVQVRPVPDRT